MGDLPKANEVLGIIQKREDNKADGRPNAERERERTNGLK